MLALVHPAPDVHRPPTSSRPHRRHTPSRSTTSSSSSSSSSAAGPSSSSTSRLPHPPPISRRAPSPPRPPPPEPPLVDIHSYPSTELLRLLASLLTQIAATNDALKDSSQAPPSHPHYPSGLTTASLNSLANPSSTLTFHARNVPTITLEAYLLRILKYCPTTNEVFLSLLVYFDRMSKLTGRAFVIDSYNIHRLVIAGVTVASKFFSDVFYTNSRYAKVGGLPQAELNQLELQFLLLNDFRLVIHPDEMQRYAKQLLLFSTNDTESEIETETEEGWTTDDEPTIRPPRSEDSCSIASEDSFTVRPPGEPDRTP